MDEQNCDGCKFFRSFGCHKRSPVAKPKERISTEKIYHGDGTYEIVPVTVHDQPEAVWPSVGLYDWCGDWEKKNGK